MLVPCEGLNILLKETAEMRSFCYVHIPKWSTALLFVTVYLLNKRRNDMRPKRYPYTKPQWETEYANVYWDSSNEPLATFVTHINKMTGEVK